MAVNTVETQAPAEEKAKLMITPSPHFRDDINTRKIMLTVATALLPALEAGDFPLTAYVTALDAETGQQLGSAEQSVTLKVEPGEGV